MYIWLAGNSSLPFLYSGISIYELLFINFIHSIMIMQYPFKLLVCPA